ncbi:hypothetical protein [Mucilaginibacter aquariorum]|uniref:DUF4142 domain-containing protein n=1 Tax=Mucilaginibacter aquariorum TaxID=2967225 RepID=A0ABT1T9H3_9SPHI|nr:hypothetical protein [Mucilaginibacter aquariorum]MCQ6961275.1 hypothetical protein [Mucilaginibacter aquariorum]
MKHGKLHIAIKCKAKKGMLFLALLLSFFTFSGAASIAQQNNLLTQSELILPNSQITRSSINYKSAARQLYKIQHAYLSSKNAFAATIVFNKLVATQHLHLISLALPNPQVVFQSYTNTPHATEPTHQLPYRA